MEGLAAATLTSGFPEARTEQESGTLYDSFCPKDRNVFNPGGTSAQSGWLLEAAHPRRPLMLDSAKGGAYINLSNRGTARHEGPDPCLTVSCLPLNSRAQGLPISGLTLNSLISSGTTHFTESAAFPP